MEVRTGAIVKKIRNFVAWAEPDPKTAFFRAQPTGNSFTLNKWYPWKAETLKACLLLVCRVCDQAFVRYRSLKGAESGQVNTKIENLHIDTSRKMLFFSIYTKNNEVIAKKRFITVASPSACERLAVLN